VIAHLELVQPRGETLRHFVLVTAFPGRGRAVEYIDGTTVELRTVPEHEFLRDWSGYVLFVQAPTGFPRHAVVVGMSVGFMAAALVWLFASKRRLGANATTRLALAGTLLAATSFPARVFGETPTLADVIEAHEAMYRALDSIRIDSVEEMTPRLDGETLFELEQRYEFGSTDRQAILLADGRTYISESRRTRSMEDIIDYLKQTQPARDPRISPTFLEITRALRHVSPTDWTVRSIFDGVRLFEDRGGTLAPLGVERSTIRVVELTGTPYVPFIPLHAAFVAFRCPAIPHQDKRRKEARLPDLLTSHSYAIVADEEDVDGVTCIRLEDAGANRIWIAPGHGYAVARHQRLQDNVVVWDMTAGGFREVLNEVWLPSRLSCTTFGWKGIHPDAYHGRALHTVDYRFITLEVNNPDHERYVQFSPTAGTLVMDETIAEPEVVASDDAGRKVRRVASYVVPADATQLDAVMKDARQRHQRGQRNWLIVAVIGVNVALVAGVTFHLLRRWRRK